MTRPHYRPLPMPPHAQEYLDRQASTFRQPDPQVVDLTGLTLRTQRVVLWSRRTYRTVPRMLQPFFRALALTLCFGWFAVEEIKLWLRDLDWPCELRVLTFAVWVLIVLIVLAMGFDLLLTYNSAGMVR